MARGGKREYLTPSEERTIRELNGVTLRGHGLALISESGLYKLVMRSDKPEVREFQNWVTKVVLPAIRKDGGYIHGEEHMVSGAMNEDELEFRLLPSHAHLFTGR